MVSVIVPNYNHAPFLKERIESILDQTYQDFELILLDDCSTDESRAVLEGYRNHPKVASIVFNEKNSGSPFAQWQKGISIAKGDWIWIAESDDVADAEFLETVMTALRMHPTVGLAYTHLRWIDADGNEMYSEDDEQEIRFYSGEQFARGKLLYTTTIYNVSSTVFRKDMLLSVDWSLFDKMKMCGDYYLYTLLAEKTDVLEIGKVLDNYRQHGHNTSGKELTSIGWGFLEGMPILDRITTRYHIPQRLYAMHYARLWVHDQLSRKVNRDVANAFGIRHWMVTACYLLLRCKWAFKN